MQKRVDYNKLIFESQIGLNGIDPTLPTGEYGDDNFSYLDLNANCKLEKPFERQVRDATWRAYFHLTEPAESFYNYNVNKLNAHYIWIWILQNWDG
ncbi:MAG: hypothetical protein IPH42_07205 [Bacteroidetes bacterium]|nr:hypothetical protein [Bacteroidota bacterium]